MAKVLILAGDTAEGLVVMFVEYCLQETGYDASVAAPTTRPIKLVVHDFEPDCDAYGERPDRQCPVDVTFAEVERSEYAGLVIPGGRAPEFIRVDHDARRIVEHFFAEDKPVGTLCHGPQVPAAFGLLRGRRSSGDPPPALDIEAARGRSWTGPTSSTAIWCRAAVGATSPSGRLPIWTCSTALPSRPSS